MVKVKTARFGEIEVDEKETILLPHGLIGFAELKHYVLLDHDKDSPFKWLQSLDDGGIAFVVINPLLFKPDYVVEVTENEVGDLDLVNEEDAVISSIITIPSDPKNMTANLKAPLIFNVKSRKGKQLILNNPNYLTKHNIMDEMAKHNQVSEQGKMEKVVKQAKEAIKSAADISQKDFINK